jgi:hypothetical protein
MQEQVMGDYVKSIRKIKTDGISLTLIADDRSHKDKEDYQISNCGFRFGEAMLVGFSLA